MTPQTIKEYREALGGRRFIMTMGAGVVNTGLFAAGIMDQATYQLLTMATVGAYLAQSVTERIKGKSEAEMNAPKAS